MTKHCKYLAQSASEDNDECGNVTSSDISHARFFALAEYKLYGDVTGFRNRMRECTRLTVSLFERHDAGEPIDHSYVTMINHERLFDALASGDFAMTETLAKLIGGRDVFEQEFDGDFDIALGYATKAVILEDQKLFNQWIPKLELAYEDEFYLFEGVGETLGSILARDQSKTIKCIQQVEKEHRVLSSKSEWFGDSPNELVSVIGIGLTNLARHRCIAVEAIPPFIPVDLLIDV